MSLLPLRPTRRGAAIAATCLAVACTLGVASATSLGTFEGEPFGAGTAPVAACRAADVEVLDGALDLVGGTVLATSAVRTVRLTGLSGDCVDAVPVIVLAGLDLTAPLAGEQVLFVLDGFAPLPGTGDVTLSVAPVPLGDGLLPLVDLTEVRVAFCPGGGPCA